MTFQEPIWQWLRARDDNETPAEELLNLLKDPFSGTVSYSRLVGGRFQAEASLCCLYSA